MTTLNELSPQLIGRHYIVEARDSKKGKWYCFGGTHPTLALAVFYRDTTVLNNARHRKARIVEITTYYWIKQPES